MKVAVLKKPVKKRRWPIVVLITLLVLILPIIGLYVFIYDGDTKVTHTDPTQTSEVIGNRILVDSLDPAKEEKKIQFAVSEADMDNMIVSALKDAGATGGAVRKAYVYVHENRYVFYVDIDLRILKTRLKFNTLLRENETKDSFIFSIQDVTLGKVSGFKDISKSIVGGFINTTSINSFIKQIGLSATYSGSDLAFIYKKADLISDICEKTKNDSIDLYHNVMEAILKDEIFTFDLKTQYFVEGTADLVPLTTNELVTDYTDQLKLTANQVGEKCRDKLVQLVNEHHLDVNSVDPSIVFKFLFAGYDHLTEIEQDKVNTVNMSSIGISDKESYKGFDLDKPQYAPHTVLTNSIKIDNLISKDSSINKSICRITENQLNNYLAGRNIVGYTSLLTRFDGDTYKANFITIDNLYCNLYKSTDKIAEFVCKVNINGHQTSLTFASTVPEGGIADGKMNFTVNEINYGQTEAQSLEESLFDLLHNALVGDDTTISAITVDKTQHSIIFDFNTLLSETRTRCEQKVYEEHGIIANFSNYFKQSNLNFNVTGTSRSSDGSITVSMIDGINY